MNNEITESQPQQMAVVAQSESTAVMRMIEVAMSRPDFDVAKLMQLMEMKERFDATEAKKAYVVAMAEFKKNSPEIYKDKNVAFSGTSYSHATLGGICEVVITSLADHGISHRWDTTQPGNGLIVVKCILTHNMGHSESTQLEAPPDNSGKKNSIQQLASTVTYLQRYTLLAACGLATKDMPDDDGRGASPEPEVRDVIKSLIGGKAFDKAIAAVKAGSYTASDINKYYALTPDQQTALDDATKESK
jgi:hypothetical protein